MRLLLSLCSASLASAWQHSSLHYAPTLACRSRIVRCSSNSGSRDSPDAGLQVEARDDQWSDDGISPVVEHFRYTGTMIKETDETPDFCDVMTPVRITILGAVVNILLSASKLGVGIITGSASLLADGWHSFGDLLSDALCWVSYKIGAVGATTLPSPVPALPSNDPQSC